MNTLCFSPLHVLSFVRRSHTVEIASLAFSLGLMVSGARAGELASGSSTSPNFPSSDLDYGRPLRWNMTATDTGGNDRDHSNTPYFAAPAASGGTWTPLVRRAPSSVQLLLLLSDGTVMAKSFAGGGDGYGNVWYKLTPDIHGSYVNGTWTTLSAMNDTRLYFSSGVVSDGRVFVAGGEYPRNTGNGILGRATAEIYDPVADAWTRIDPPTSVLDPSMLSPIFASYHQAFVDSISEILPDGKVLVAPVAPKVRGGTVIYDPATNVWSSGPILANNVAYQDEASWVKLPDDSVLTVDPFGTNSERYIPSTNAWISDSTVPVNLYDPYGFEMGAGFLLPNGNAFFLGSTGHTAIYTPSGTTSPGTWVAGPDIPNAQGTPDAAGAMMANGKILCAVSPIPTSGNHFPTPTSFYEYDYATNSFAQVSAPVGSTDNISSYLTMMLDLPDGTVLYSHFGDQLYDYTPTGSPLASGKPTISSIQWNADGSYHLTGTLLNGISEGAAYGDDNQMASNYPIVRLTALNGNVYYARTYNWSSTGVMTGNTPVSTEFKLPAGLPLGTYSVLCCGQRNQFRSLLACGFRRASLFPHRGSFPENARRSRNVRHRLALCRRAWRGMQK